LVLNSSCPREDEAFLRADIRASTSLDALRAFARDHEISTPATFQVHVNLLTCALGHPGYRGAGRINVCGMKTSFEFVTVTTAIVFDVERELELLERCARECSLIAECATDSYAKCEHQALASEYREIAEALRSYRGATVVPASRRSAFL
jgi:hypothetical protein